MANSNSWPGGKRHAMTQAEHERWNAKHYPGTLQLCIECESETGRCEEDAMYSGDHGPLCNDCYQAVIDEMGEG